MCEFSSKYQNGGSTGTLGFHKRFLLVHRKVFKNSI